MLGYGVKETTTTTGTGTVTLSAVSGFPRFANAFNTGDLVEYSLLNSSGQPIECGIGTVSAGNTLARTYPLVTWNGTTYDNTAPSAVSLTGTTTVICTGTPGSGFPFVQALSTAAASQVMFSPHFAGPASSTLAVVANTLYLHPYQVVVNRPMAGLAVRVSTGAGTNATLGLYRCDTTGSPTTLLQSGSIVSSSSGVKSISFSAYYPPGWYFMAFVADSNPTVNVPSSTPGPSPLGVDASLRLITATTTANGSITLPSPFSGTQTQLFNSASFPAIGAIFT